MELLQKLAQSLEAGAEEQVFALTKAALEQGLTPREILDDGLLAGMKVVGERFRRHAIFLPDVLLAAKAMYAGLEQLKPLLIRDGVPGLGKVVLGTVQGDLHDIGKNLVGIMLQGAGFEVIDLGKNVPPERFVDTAVAEDARIIGMSALLTTTTPLMHRVTTLLHERKLTDKIKTIIGGASVSRAYAREIGADAYAYDATKAVECVKQFFGRD